MDSISSREEVLIRIRTITAFVIFLPSDFEEVSSSSSSSSSSFSTLECKIQQCSVFLSACAARFVDAGYEVQTLRLATNPFGEYLVSLNNHKKESSKSSLYTDTYGLESTKTTRTTTTTSTTLSSLVFHQERLDQLDKLLEKYNISFASLGPAMSIDEIQFCPLVISKSNRLSCSAMVQTATDCRAAAEIVLELSRMDVLNNFRFAGITAACLQTSIPFFPAASAPSAETLTPKTSDGALKIKKKDSNAIALPSFALGFENGPLVHHLLKKCGSIEQIPTVFASGMTEALLPMEKLCCMCSEEMGWKYMGMDVSLNPSLSDYGSIASAVEQLDDILCHFGGPGTVAASASLTMSLQQQQHQQQRFKNNDEVTKTGFCGIMLPVCEDRRLANLSSKLRVADLLQISAVCGVGIDTLPVAGDVTVEQLTAIFMDVAYLGTRWNKPLSCRMFPIPGKTVGEWTEFDSPYLCNSKIWNIAE
jgi:uncharacterized protein